MDQFFRLLSKKLHDSFEYFMDILWKQSFRFGKRSSEPATPDTHHWADLLENSLMAEAAGYSLRRMEHRSGPARVRLHPRFLVMTV